MFAELGSQNQVLSKFGDNGQLWKLQMLLTKLFSRNTIQSTDQELYVGKYIEKNNKCYYQRIKLTYINFIV